MDITKIDKNFKQREVTDINGVIYKLPCEPFTVCGGWYDKDFGFIKVPLNIAKEASNTVLWGSRCTAGVRVLFSTNSKSMKIRAEIFQKCLMNHMALTGSASFTLCEVVEEKEIFIANFIPSLNIDEDFMVAQCDLKGEQMRNYVLYFPLYSGVKSLEIEFDASAEVEKYIKYRDKKPILYYGSSITQGGCASRPNSCYQAYISEWTNIDYLLLGYSGGARAEDAICDYLSNVDCSIFVCDYDHNAPSAEYLNNTHKKLYKKFRSTEKNKNTPIIFMTKPDGLRDIQGEIRANIIKETYEYAKNNGDDNVYFIDGRSIYPERIREHCAVDGCHPTDLGFYFMAEKLYETVKKLS